MLAKDCELADEDKEIIAQIIQRCTSSRLCRRALREPDKTLTDLLVLGRMLKDSEKQVEGIEEKAAAAVSALYFKSSQQQHVANRYTEKNTQCIHCGGRYPHQGNCPANGKDCRACVHTGLAWPGSLAKDPSTRCSYTSPNPQPSSRVGPLG